MKNIKIIVATHKKYQMPETMLKLRALLLLVELLLLWDRILN